MTRTMARQVRNGAVALVFLTAATGCAGDDAPGVSGESAAVAAAPAADTGMQGMAGMEGMQGMEGMSGTMGMMQQMQSHMQMMASAPADSLMSMMPMHRQMTANMLAGMNREMQGMNMSGDPAWRATMDSVRRDLTVLPELRGAELRDAVKAHGERLQRLMDSHQAMMQNMKM